MNFQPLGIDQAMQQDLPIIRQQIIIRERIIENLKDQVYKDKLHSEISMLRSQANKLLHKKNESRSYWIAPGF